MNNSNRAVNWIKHFSRRKLVDNKNIIELLKYDNYSLWWFLEWLLEFGTFHFLDINSILADPYQLPRRNKTANIFKLLRTPLRKGVWFFFKSFGIDEERHHKKLVLFISNLNQSIYDKHKKQFVMDEVFLPIINSIKNIDIAVLNLPYKQEIGFSAYNKGLDKGTLFFPIEQFMGIPEFFRALKQSNHYKKIWNKIKESNSLDFIEPNIKKHLIYNFNYFFSSYLLLTLWEIEAYKTFVDKHKPNLICTYDPFNPYGFKPRLAFKGKMLAIQHGFWGTPESEYIHDKYDLQTYPLTDFAAVYDSKIKDNLANLSNFPKDRLFITGNPKAEEIHMKLKLFSIQISEESVLFLSQPFNDQKEFSIFLKEVFDFFKKIPNEIKVVRPHPNETNIKIYQSLIEKHGIKNVSISRGEDILLPLSKSKLVISCNSTAIIEAQLIGKPAVIMDVLKKGYNSFFSKVPSVKNSKELYAHFISLKPKKLQQKLSLGTYKNLVKVIYKLS